MAHISFPYMIVEERGLIVIRMVLRVRTRNDVMTGYDACWALICLSGGTGYMHIVLTDVDVVVCSHPYRRLSTVQNGCFSTEINIANRIVHTLSRAVPQPR